MNIRFLFFEKKVLLLSGVFMFFMFTACQSDKTELKATHDPNKAVTVSSFAPTEGGVRDKILLDGDNFGSDTSIIKVYFNKKEASVISSSGKRIYAIVPRLPGDICDVSVVIDGDSVVYDEQFIYHTQATVSTIAGNGNSANKGGTLAEAEVWARYVAADDEGNVFASYRDGGFGLFRINENENTASILSETDDGNVLTPNGVTVDPETNLVAIAPDRVRERFITYNPIEGWVPREHAIKYSDDQKAAIVDGHRWKNFMSFCTWDSAIYTRNRDGTLTKINRETLEPTVYKDVTPFGGTNYGQAFDPTHPTRLYFTFHSNAGSFSNTIAYLDVTDPEGAGALKKINPQTSRGFRDGPLEQALFDLPHQIAFDQDGNMFIADYGNHCIRMLSADGIVTTIAGQPGVKGFADGGPEESLFSNPWGIDVDKDGVVYIADRGNARIRKLVVE